jgi:hypothetical protein
MKLSDKATAHVLLKAGTNSEWDNCNFAIIHITEDWKRNSKNGLKWLSRLQDYFLQSMKLLRYGSRFLRLTKTITPIYRNGLKVSLWHTWILTKKNSKHYPYRKSLGLLQACTI